MEETLNEIHEMEEVHSPISFQGVSIYDTDRSKNQIRKVEEVVFE